MKINEVYKKGSFGKKLIYYSFKKQRGSSNYFFFLHGVYSTCLKQKYFYLADKISNKKLGNVFLFESSRKVYTFETKLDFKQYVKTFEGKTFNDELQDVLNIFEYFYGNFVKNKKTARIFLIGFSLGGTLASYLLPIYGDRVKGVVLFGSGVTTKGINKPITKTYPSKNSLLSNFKTFEGILTLVQGSNDIIVPLIEAREIIDYSDKAFIRSLIILKGVDHRFVNINDTKRENYLIKMIINIIKNSINFS